MEEFTTTSVINKMMALIEKNTTGWRRLNKLKEDMGYAAPEIINERFWGHPRSRIPSITSVCKTYFDDNVEINDIYNEAVTKYTNNGFSFKCPS
tara:strand:- start:708 stop:989 length:282 start_codon:yes stop_codon:yes gene_type:complete